MYEHCLNMQSVKKARFSSDVWDLNKQKIVNNDKYVNLITVYLKYSVY